MLYRPIYGYTTHFFCILSMLGFSYVFGCSLPMTQGSAKPETNPDGLVLLGKYTK
jgi:hypothetical protein